MDKQKYTAMQILQIRGSFIYFVMLALIAVIATSFQVISKVPLSGILFPLMLNITAITLAFIIYRRKSALKNVTVLIWIIGFITVTAPIMGKYNYIKTIGNIPEAWTFSMESHNTTIYVVIMMVLLQLHFNKKLFVFFSVYGIANWLVFIALALAHGANVHIQAMDGNIPLHGVIMTREAFFVIIVILILRLTYRNIPLVFEFDERTTAQRRVIEDQARAQLDITAEITDSMGDLFKQVDHQNGLVTSFNDKMQSQTATFEELSASLEELQASAESIHKSSVNLIDGNVKMEEIVTEFKNIKQETRTNLETTYANISNVVEMTNISNTKLAEVENTIGLIKEQGQKIAETVSIITEIADRINLLSLNASIEAARAGEFGRGFAVVADEIGKLAFQTSESIKDVEKVLLENRKITTDGVDVINDTAGLIKKLINHMGESSVKVRMLQDSLLVEEKYIRIIIDQMSANIDLARSIGTGTDEQKTAIISSSEAVEHVNGIVFTMAREVQELANISANILESANGLIEKARKAVV